MSDVLLLVAIKTDQPNVKRRIETILAAAQPIQDPPNTEAQVWTREVEDGLVAADLDGLARYFGWNGIRRLNVGDVVVQNTAVGPPEDGEPSVPSDDAGA